MADGTVIWVGPIKIDALYEVSASWDGNGGANIGGEVYWKDAWQLRELINNKHYWGSQDGAEGAQAYVAVEQDLFWPFRGWYLLNSFSLDADDFSTLWGPDERVVRVKFGGHFVGDNLKLMSVVSARAKSNTVGVAGAALVVNPLWDPESVGSPMLVEPLGGTRFTREYNEADYGETPSSRQLTMYEVPPDSYVTVPRMELHSYEIHPWVSSRGNMVRAYDLREMRYVHGSHPYRIPSDAMLENGLLRVRAGNQGLIPYLSISAMVDGDYVDCGCVHLDSVGGLATLDQVRLLRLSRDSVTLAMGVRGKGEYYATLKRGERFVRLVLGSNEPYVPGTGKVSWQGAPPAFVWTDLVNAAGRYGNGLSLEAGEATMLWPPTQPVDAWSLGINWVPPEASGTQDDQIIWRIRDKDRNVAVTCEYVDSNNTFRVTVEGVGSVSSSTVAFDALEPIFLGVRHSDTRGTSLTVRVGGVVAHYKDILLVGSGTASYHRIQLGAAAATSSLLVWGEGDWGDGDWGGDSVGASDGLGTVDNMMIFEQYLEDAEMAALASSPTALGGIPETHGMMIWYASFDSAPIPTSAAFATNSRLASADANGLSSYLLALSSSVSGGDFILEGAMPFEVAAGLATSGTKDGAADHHKQFGSEWVQRELLR